MRAQNAVLKKAVVDEQAKNNEMNELIRTKNQIIRKVDQEMEALKFRNSQLTVRITVLQDELDSQNNVSRKKFMKVHYSISLIPLYISLFVSEIE